MGRHSKLKIRCLKCRNWLAVFMGIVSFGAWVPLPVPVGEPQHVHPPSEEPVVGPLPRERKTPAPSPSPSTRHVTPPPPSPHVEQPPPPRPHRPKPPPPHDKPVTPTPVATKPTSVLVSFLRAQLGKPYAWGGNGPHAYDCSGLTLAAYAKVGIHLPRTSEAQSVVGKRVSLNDLKVGDLLFWGTPGLAFHVAIYIGGGHYIAAQNPLTGVVQLTLSFYSPTFARRLL